MIGALGFGAILAGIAAVLVGLALFLLWQKTRTLESKVEPRAQREKHRLTRRDVADLIETDRQMFALKMQEQMQENVMDPLAALQHQIGTLRQHVQYLHQIMGQAQHPQPQQQPHAQQSQHVASESQEESNDTDGDMHDAVE